MKFLKIIISIKVIVILICAQNSAFSAEFSDSGFNIVDLRESDAAWGDYNNDGYLDLAICGDTGSTYVTKIYKNVNGTQLIDSGINLQVVRRGSLAWGDYDRDGYLDLVISGAIEFDQGKTIIYHNNGNETFSDSGVKLEGLYFSMVAWGDYDIDGDLDLLLSGFETGGNIILIYQNNGDGTFSDSGIDNLTPVSSGSAAWADYDNDGDLDLVITGATGIYGLNPFSKLYKNNDGSFEEVSISPPLTDVQDSDVAWADYDNDGDLDLALIGRAEIGEVGVPVTKIYQNGGSSNNYDLIESTSLSGLVNSSLAWGDYDNDGDIDLVLCGNDGAKGVTKLYENNGSGSFVEDTNTETITGVELGSICWADYDDDKDLDLLITGDNDGSAETVIYKNDEADEGNPNTLPDGDSINIFKSDFDPDTGILTLGWDPGSDDETTDSDGLYYNIMLGSESGKDDIVAARYGSPLLGNFISKSTGTVDGEDGLQIFQIEISTPSGYFWRVQIIDTSLGRSWSSISGDEWSEVGWTEENQYIDTTDPVGKPSTPEDEGDSTYNTTLTFTWTQGTAEDEETGIAGYHLQVGTTPEGNGKLDEDAGDNLSAEVTGCRVGRTYYARVRAYHGYTGTASSRYTDWSGSSDGIIVIELLRVRENVIHPTKDDYAIIEFGVIEDSRVKVYIYNLAGDLVKKLVDEDMKAASSAYQARWYGDNDDDKTVASGIYLVHIETSSGADTKKIAVIK